MKKYRWKWLFISLFAMFLVVGCSTSTETSGSESNADSSSNGESYDEPKGEIRIGVNDWAENVAVANMWKLLLEEKGYEVELVSVQKAALFAGLETGDLDLGLEIWLPYTDEVFYEDYKDDIEWHTDWYNGTGLGLVVPEYVDINSIDELKENEDLFEEKRIVGIDPGASLMQLTEKAMEEYELDYELMSSSGPIMTAELDNAINKEEPIVVTLWNPHWAFADYDLKYLEDPKGVYGEGEDITFASRSNFGDDHPDVMKWLTEWHMDDDSLGSLMAVINEEGDPEAGAQIWIEDNRDLIDGWLSAE